MMEKEFQRWTAKRKVELLLQLMKGETKLVDACREHDLKQSEVEAWLETFVTAGERGLKARSEDERAVQEREMRELRAKVGELVLLTGGALSRVVLRRGHDSPMHILTCRTPTIATGIEGGTAIPQEAKASGLV
jgi:transposase-like protein